MPIPDLLKPSDYEFFHPQPRPKSGWPPRDTPEAMVRALNHACDDLRKQEKINTAHLAEINELQSKLRVMKIKLWVTTVALLGLWEVFKFFVLHR